MANEHEQTEEEWIASERERVVDYLADEGCRHAGVAEWPVFHVSPHVALWAVQSTRHVGRVGWWAISGDVPVDYMSSADGELPREALTYFSNAWLEVAGYMRRGESHPTLDLGDPEDWPGMAAMLEERARILKEFAEEPDAWTEG